MTDGRGAALGNAGIGLVLRSLHLPPRSTALEIVRTPPMSRGTGGAASGGVPDVSLPSRGERSTRSGPASELAPGGVAVAAMPGPNRRRNS